MRVTMMVLMTLKDYRKNIPKSYAINFLRSMFFAVPIITIFLLSNGLNMRQVLLLEAYFSILLVFLEVPAGAIADMIGRKYSIIAGFLILTTAPVVWGLGHNFFDFMIADTLWAAGSALISGAYVAILYDTTKKLGMKSRIKSVLSNSQFYALAGVLASSAIFGFIALNDPTYRWAFYLTGIPFFIAALLAFSLKEPELYKRERFDVERYYTQIFRSINYVKNNRHLSLLFLNFALIVTFGRIGFWFFQPYMKSSGIDVVLFGIAFMLINAFSALSAKIAPRVDKIFGMKNSIFLFSMLQGASFVGMAVFLNPAAAVFLIVLQEFVWGAATPLFLSYIHERIKSRERATLESFGGMVGNVTFAALSTFFGFISDAFSMQAAFATLGTAIIIQMILFKLEDA